MMQRIALIILSAGLLIQGAAAKYTAQQKQELLDRQPGLTSKSAQRRLMRANEFIVKNDRAEAIKILEKMTQKTNYRPFEKAKIWQTLAYAYAQQEKYPQARKAFKSAIDQNALPYKPTLQSIFALAQLELMNEKYSTAEKYLSDWFSLSKEEKPDAYVFLATIQFHKGEKKKALNSILKGLSLAKKPKESWLTFAVSLLYEEARYKEAGEMLFKLTEINTGKKMYWTQLAGSLLNANKSLEALAVLDLALKMNLLTQEGEFHNIISLHLSNDLPYEASRLMQTALDKKVLKSNKKNLELLANSLIQAKEYEEALSPLDQAAKLSKDGKLFALKARLHLEKEQFKTAINYFDQALQRGLEKKQKGQVLIEKAVALIQIKDIPQASLTLAKAAKIPTASKMAQNWQNYISKL
jgi:tetratricopeptide (TPR) repeat protein